MNAKEIVSQVTNLPTLPQATIKLLHLLKKPDENMQAALDLIQTDPVLSAKLLRICNSAAIGLRQPVASVDNAVYFLGFNEVQRLAIAIGMGGSLKRSAKDPLQVRDLWYHSVVTAHTASMIASDIEAIHANPSVVFTAALMHDLGKLVVTEALSPEQLATLRASVAAGQREVDAERALLQTDHAEIGAHLLELWRMPEILVESVRNHHNPVCKPDPCLSLLVHVADCVAHQIGEAPGWTVFCKNVNQDAAAFLGFDAPKLAETLQLLSDQKKKMDQFALAA